MKIQITKENIEEIHDELRATILPWETDNHAPPNYIRKNGMGEVVAIVDVWCGGYQSPHNPGAIGWSVKQSNQSKCGMLIVNNFKRQHPANVESKSAATLAVEKAKELADEMVKSYYEDSGLGYGQ